MNGVSNPAAGVAASSSPAPARSSDGHAADAASQELEAGAAEHVAADGDIVARQSAELHVAQTGLAQVGSRGSGGVDDAIAAASAPAAASRSDGMSGAQGSASTIVRAEVPPPLRRTSAQTPPDPTSESREGCVVARARSRRRPSGPARSNGTPASCPFVQPPPCNETRSWSRAAELPRAHRRASVTHRAPERPSR